MLLDIPVIPVSFAYNNTTQLPAGVMDATASREMSSMGVLHARRITRCCHRLTETILG